MNKKFFFRVVIIAAMILIGSNTAFATSASMSLSPASGSYVVNSEFVVDVRVNTGGQKVTAVGAYLVYDSTRLEVVSIDSSTSAFSVQAEQVTNGNQIKISRGQQTPGVNSSNALVAKVKFKVKFAGTASIVINKNSSGPGESRVVLDDGQGTNILSSVTSGVYIGSSGSSPTPSSTPTPTPVSTPVPTPVPSNSCILPWGGAISHGQSVRAYNASDVGCGSQCQSELRICTNGVLSGSYTKSACKTGSCACDLPWGGTTSEYSSVRAYRNSSVPCGSTCAYETRKCVKKILSGTYTNKTCSVADCPSCNLPWGETASSGRSVAAYQNPTVPYGSKCISETRKCTNGVLSGSYANKTCKILPRVATPTPVKTPTPTPTPKLVPTITPLPYVTNCKTVNFKIGDKVSNQYNLNVRQGPGYGFERTGVNPKNAQGVVVDVGQAQSNTSNYCYWKVDYDTGFDGWVVGDYLEKIVSDATPTTEQKQKMIESLQKQIQQIQQALNQIIQQLQAISGQ